MYRSIIFSSILRWLLLLSKIVVVHGYSGGAGACNAGTAAVGSSHTRPGALTGTLTEGDIGITLDGMDLQSGVNYDFTIGETHTLVLSRTQSFRGVLFRLEAESGEDISTALTFDDSRLTNAFACASPVFGVCHSSSSEKQDATVTLDVDEPATLQLDITVVISNGAISEYYYSGYSLNAVQAVAQTISPTPKPSDEPTFHNTASPTSNPTLEPTASPTTLPTSRPTLNPTAPPTATSTVEPTADPTALPTSALTASPTESPTDSAISLPTMPTATSTSTPTASPAIGTVILRTSSPTSSARKQIPLNMWTFFNLATLIPPLLILML